jgi:hypothetical protein
LKSCGCCKRTHIIPSLSLRSYWRSYPGSVTLKPKAILNIIQILNIFIKKQTRSGICGSILATGYRQLVPYYIPTGQESTLFSGASGLVVMPNILGRFPLE